MNFIENVTKLGGQRVLPCAFCGVQPTVFYSMGLIFLKCETTNCPASSTQNMTTDELEILRRWNHRKASTTS